MLDEPENQISKDDFHGGTEVVSPAALSNSIDL